MTPQRTQTRILIIYDPAQYSWSSRMRSARRACDAGTDSESDPAAAAQLARNHGASPIAQLDWQRGRARGRGSQKAVKQGE
jgi:hypothetical protein